MPDSTPHPDPHSWPHSGDTTDWGTFRFPILPVGYHLNLSRDMAKEGSLRNDARTGSPGKAGAADLSGCASGGVAGIGKEEEEEEGAGDGEGDGTDGNAGSQEANPSWAEHPFFFWEYIPEKKMLYNKGRGRQIKLSNLNTNAKIVRLIMAIEARLPDLESTSLLAALDLGAKNCYQLPLDEVIQQHRFKTITWCADTPGEITQARRSIL